MTTEILTTPALKAWREVIVLLYEASDRAEAAAATHQALHSPALWADLIGSAAQNLLPSDHGYLLEEVSLRPDVVEQGFAGMVIAAEELTRAYPIEEFPPGASGIIVELCRLASQVTT